MPSAKTFLKDALFGPIVPQRVWERLRTLSLRGMNIGGGSDITDSGERWLLDRMKDHLRSQNPAVVFDVGANVGSYAEEVRSRLTENLRLFCFEPARATMATLRRALGEAAGVDLIPFGLSDRDETVELYTDPTNTGLASLYARDLTRLGVSLTTKETVHLTTLDAFCAAHSIARIHLLKLDCEGHELKALAGAANLLAGGAIEAIQFEFGGCNLDSRTYFRDFYSMLTPGYRLYRILRRGLAAIPEYHERMEVFTTTNFLALRPDHPLARANGSRR